MTVLEVIQKSAEFLTKRGVDSPRLQAELLLAQVLKLPRMKLYLNFERKLTEAEANAMREFVKRRGARVPLQHILGSTSFCGFEIVVNRHVLVPRPETELLAELGWKFLAERAGGVVAAGILPAVEPGFQPGGEGSDHLTHMENSSAVPGGKMPPSTAGRMPAATTALDFGTGSGCIAIALAAKCPAARLVALEVSAEALALAKQNAERNGVAGRIQFTQGDGFAAIPAGSNFDLIISNPPYIPTAEIESLQPEVRDFDPRTALDGGADGLELYRRLAAEAAAFLKPAGKIMLEFGDGQADEIRKIFGLQMWIVVAVREDYSQRQRILIARRS